MPACTPVPLGTSSLGVPLWPGVSLSPRPLAQGQQNRLLALCGGSAGPWPSVERSLPEESRPRGWEDAGQNWSLCWDLSAHRAKAAGVVAAPGPGQRHGAPGAVQLCRPRAPWLLAPERLASHAGRVCLPLMPLPPAPVAPRTAVLRAEVCLQTWSRLACAHQPGQRLVWGSCGRLGGRGRPGLGAQPREGPLQGSVWTWGLCLAFSARWPAYPEPFPDSLSAGPWEGLCPPGCPDPLHPGGGRLGARNAGGNLHPMFTHTIVLEPQKTEHFAEMKGKGKP